ncbi:hypothetical protein N9Y92_04195 [Chlamydiales bacterium]|nr:hypothetical protein [Chlamydiales bacterium]
MNEYPKTKTAPTKVINPPKELTPLIKAFHAESKETMNTLVMDAARAIKFRDPIAFGDSEPSEDDVSLIIDLMKGINPQSTEEVLIASQIICSHMIGMRKLSSIYEGDHKIGLRMIKFSNEALQKLERNRGGGVQNITVNHVYPVEGSILSQTRIKE